MNQPMLPNTATAARLDRVVTGAVTHRAVGRAVCWALCLAMCLALSVLWPSTVQAQTPPPVVVSGTVPDEATRASILARVRELYGAERVVDQLTVGAVVAPPQWSQYVGKLLSPGLKQVHHGQLAVQGQVVQLQGEVDNEGQRQQLASDMAQALNPTYSVRNGLQVSAQEQSVVDRALANRTVEFEPGSAVLRPAGQQILNEMATVLLQLRGRRVALIGHTDALGPRPGNVSLSLARAQAARAHLVSRGVSPDSLSASGMGPDQPLATNATEEGRARNRRIEFRVGS